MKHLWWAVSLAVPSFFNLWTLGAAKGLEHGSDDVANSASELAVRSPRDLPDIAIASNPALDEEDVAVAGNPNVSSQYVAVAYRRVANDYGARSGRCIAFSSSDGGRRWSAARLLPQLSGGYCWLAPAVAYAPDGTRVYAAYQIQEGIVVSSSDDNGLSWRRPVIAFQDNAEWTYQAPALATPVSGDSNRVHLAAERGHPWPWAHAGQVVVFKSSADKGATWGNFKELAGGYYDSNELSYPSVAGGLGGEVLVAWSDNNFTSENVGVLVSRSGNFGSTFDTPVLAARDASRRGSARVVDIKFSRAGVAHLVYERDPPSAADDTDIGYIWSARSPYVKWPAEPMTVSDDVSGRPQRSPSLSIQPCGSYGVVNVVWQDPRNSPAATPARLSDVYFAQKVALTGYGWSRNTRLSNRSSLGEIRSEAAEVIYIFDMQPSVTASGASIVAAWTDRRDKTNLTDEETDTYSSRVVTGVSCP